MEYWIFIIIIGMIVKKFFDKWDEISDDFLDEDEHSLHRTFKEEKEEYFIAPPIEEVLKERK